MSIIVTSVLQAAKYKQGQTQAYSWVYQLDDDRWNKLMTMMYGMEANDKPPVPGFSKADYKTYAKEMGLLSRKEGDTDSFIVSFRHWFTLADEALTDLLDDVVNGEIAKFIFEDGMNQLKQVKFDAEGKVSVLSNLAKI
jgi:hypothetical protein